MRFRWALLVVALGGFVSLSFVILWARVFSFTTAGAPSVFGRVLAAFLIGLAQGAAVSRRFVDRPRDTAAERALRTVAVAIAAATIASYLVVPGPAWLAQVGVWQAGFVLVVIAAFTLGLVLPIVSHLGIAAEEAVGARLSYLYLASILGPATGSLTTGLVLADRWPTQRIALMLAIVGVATAGLVALSAERRPPASVKAPHIAGLVLGVVATVAILVASEGPLAARLYERMLYKSDAPREPAFAEKVETRAGVIAVTRDGTVFGGGAYDGVISTRLVRDPNLLVRTYALAAMHPRPARLLQSGVATGAWTQVLAHLPGVEQVVAVEINAGCLPIIDRHPAVRPVLHDPRMRLVIDDGRRWLARHPDERFDAIVMNTMWHCRAHTSNLLSSELLALARAHVRPGGILYYNTTWSLDAVKAALATFPYVLRCVNSLALSDAPIAFDETRWAMLLRGLRGHDGRPEFPAGDPVAAARLDSLLAFGHSLDAPPRGYGLQLRASLATRVAGAHVVTDDNGRVEWRPTPPMALP